MRMILSIILILLFISSCKHQSKQNETLPPPPPEDPKYIITVNGKFHYFYNDSVYKAFKDSLGINDSIIR